MSQPTFADEFNLADYFLHDRVREGRGDRVAMRFGDRAYTYRETSDRAHAFASSLRANGARQEQRVLIILPDLPPFAWALMGTLEAGCGLGHFTIATQALGYATEGLDWSGDTIERLRRQFPQIPWHVGDARLLPFEAASFDAVYSPGVCEHFEDGPVAVLAEAHRVLRRGGIAVVSAPCFNDWLQHHEELLPNEAPEAAAFYQYAFTTNGLATLLERLGFAAGSMGPKVQAACDFARNTGKVAVISSLENIEDIVKGTAGTRVSTAKPGISYR